MNLYRNSFFIIIPLLTIGFEFTPTFSQNDTITEQAISKKKYELKIITDSDGNQYLKNLSYKKIFPDSITLKQELQKIILHFHQNGYLSASFDSIMFDSIHKSIVFNCFLRSGKKYNWLSLNTDKTDPVILKEIRFKKKSFENKPIHYEQIVKTENKILSYSENNGYPFATIGLDSMKWKEQTLSANLRYTPGSRIQFDSLTIHGETKTKKSYLVKTLQIQPGQYYEEIKYTNILTIVNRTGFMKCSRTPEVRFVKEKAFVHIFLNDFPSNEADGIVGLVSDNTTDKKVQLTGELRLKLRNLFGTGKSFFMEWKKLQRYSQDLELSYFHPNFIISRLDLQVDFAIIKYDTTYQDVKRKIIFKKNLRLYNTLFFSAELNQSRLIQTKHYNPNFLPSYSDNDFTGYGLGFERNTLDDIFYPKNGYSGNISVIAGLREILKNSHFSDAAYQNSQLKTTQYKINTDFRFFHQLNRKLVFHNRFQYGKIQSQKIFINEQYRFGGLKTLRGFDEKSLLAKEYLTGTAELQFYFEEFTYIFVFADQAHYKGIKADLSEFEDSPTGFGTGISFYSKAGVFTFIYSLNRSKDNKINLETAKIHLGYISRF